MRKEAVAHPLAFGAYVAWSLVSSLFLTPLALCTMDSADWGTRTRNNKRCPLATPTVNTPASETKDDSRSCENKTFRSGNHCTTGW